MEAASPASHVHDAIRQVRELKRRVLEAERFTGYSGRSRAVGGTAALIAGLAMSRPDFPQTPDAHLAGWLTLLAIAVVGNYSALLYWFFFHPTQKKELSRLIPTVDAFPPLLVGGLFTGVLVQRGLYSLLFGTWMCLYGLANLSSRRVLPKAIWPLGLFYIGSGAAFLVAPDVSFTSPLGAALVFFLGEWVGGFIFHYNRRPNAPLSSFFGRAGDPYGRKD
jgi:hypothetical protein